MTSNMLKKLLGGLIFSAIIAMYIALMGSHSNNVSDRAIFSMAQRLADKFTHLEAQAQSLSSLVKPDNTLLDLLIQGEAVVAPGFIDLYRSYSMPDISREIAVKKGNKYAYWGFQIADVKRIDEQNVAVFFKGTDLAEVIRMEKAFDGENTNLPSTTGKIRYSEVEDGYEMAIYVVGKPDFVVTHI